MASPKEKNNTLKERHFQQRERAAPAVSVLPEVVSGENSTRLCMGRSSLEGIAPVYVRICRPALKLMYMYAGHQWREQYQFMCRQIIIRENSIVSGYVHVCRSSLERAVPVYVQAGHH